MNQSELASELGVSSRAVRYALRQGRLSPPGPDGFDPVKARREWAMNTNPGVSAVTDDTDDDDQVDYRMWRGRREKAAAELAELDVAARRGELVEADWVESITASACTELRVTLELLPDSLSVELANQTDEGECRAILAQALEQAVNAFEQKLGALSE